MITQQCNQNINSIQTKYFLNNSVQSLFEQQVERTPDAVAVVFEEQQLTYQELNLKANQLAHYLQKLGVGPEVLVGICVERSLEMLVGLLGILKAGGAYVPLDPRYPKERLAFMLSDTKVSVLLTQKQTSDELFEQQPQMVYLDTAWDSVAKESQENPVEPLAPHHLAYVMYTSGSTGKPKGVQMTHASVLSYLQSLNKVLQVQADDVYLHTASFSFSSSVRQLMLPLSQGCRIILANYEQTRNPLSLFELIQKQGVTVFDTVQSVWRHGLQALESLDPTYAKGVLQSSLRLVVFSGGLLPCQLLKRLRRSLGNKSQIVNIYGQTETIGVSAYQIPPEFDQEQGYVPVGYPLAHTQVYILDSNLQPVQKGEKGELHVAGVGLARGYLNRPELTSEQFIFNPFGEGSTARLYKTGDVARYLPDGAVEILGRLNYQVKIRGMRVELGEIELALEQHPTVREAVVTSVENVSADTRLVAYLVPKLFPDGRSQMVSIGELRGFLKKKLPEYMVPSSFVTIAALPLTPNGKVDRCALAALDLARQKPAATFVSPRNDLESQLTQIWEEILGIQSIGVRDDFFDLGGHSLLAVRLFAQIEKRFGKKLPLSSLFKSGTVEDLAQLIRKEELASGNRVSITDMSVNPVSEDKPKDLWSSLVEIQPKGSQPPLFCIHGLGGEVLCYRYLARHLGADQPVYGLQPQGLDDKRPPLTRVEYMAKLYMQEIKTIQPQGPYYIAGYSFGGVVAFEIAQQFCQQGEKVALLALIDTCRPGYAKRLPFSKRVFEHIDNFCQQGTVYLQQKLMGWREWSRHIISEKYKPFSLLSETSERLLEDDANPYVVEANGRALNQYVFQVYPGKITLLRTEDKKRYSYVGMQYDPQFGWGELADGGIDVHYIAGSHASLMQEPDVQVLAEKLQVCLAQINWREETIKGYVAGTVVADGRVRNRVSSLSTQNV
ncbi:MAG: amino acid adenylation domain-containing protein [Chroococcidiopsidaceae cyanobacterium CP_BM_ER_R8_30]|nr:amino acid adenylation domain-containing protein [Chroococcidiopsidaceae cyanobacterium CP_BM_ER_R8_30]